ncbi:hypothetical protein [Streptomyces sp. Je 1-4 4N24_ara]|uniref:hypothetical protein n=1 Tax=Streptomyces sp. Je 1-4 4N24_ara TaxID=2993654 RepID=UPI002245C47E|nr:hypothetical protein [Streptomyces sp. Je 1-4 4N24_ara]
MADSGRRTGEPAAGRAVLVVGIGVGEADVREDVGAGTAGDGDDAGNGRRLSLVEVAAH